MIAPWCTCQYEGEFTQSGWEGSEIVVQGKSCHPSDDKCLVGHEPKIRFWNGRLILDAAKRKRASLSTASFGIGDVVERVAQPGDKLMVVRTGRGGTGLSIVREGGLVLALGAVSRVSLGKPVVVSGVRGIAITPDGPVPEPVVYGCIGFQVGEQRTRLRARESAELEGYRIYVERLHEDGTPGVDECVSITSSDDWKVRNAAMRSAILHLYGQEVLLDW